MGALGVVLAHHLAVEEVHRPVRHVGVARVVGHHADRGPFRVQLLQQRHHRVPVLRVQVPRGLVRQQDQRLAHDRPGHRHPLLLTSRELARVVLHPVRHPDPLQCRLHPLPALAPPHPPVRQGQLHVLVDRQVPDQVERLEHEPDRLVADLGPLPRAQVLHRLPVQEVLPPRRRVEQPQDRQERRLPAPRRARDGDELTALDVEVDPAQGVGLHLVGVEHLLELVQMDQRLRPLGHASSSPFVVIPGTGTGVLGLLRLARLGRSRFIGSAPGPTRRSGTCPRGSPRLQAEAPLGSRSRSPSWPRASR